MNRDKSIIWLRFIATVLITNSHFETPIYPEALSFLRFGGYFGNCIFFFVSGYCLSRTKLNFPRFCLKRVLRVYTPYILWIPFLFWEGSLNGLEWGKMLFPIEHYHFIPTIITLYPIYYLCVWLNNNTKMKYIHCFGAALLIQLVYFIFIYDFSYPITEGYSFIPVASFFQIMLLGGFIRENHAPEQKKALIYLAGVGTSFLVYALQKFYPFGGYLQIVRLFTGVVFTYCLGCFAVSLEGKLPMYKPVEFLSGLTLEIYIVQSIIIWSFMRTAFPAGLILCVISIVATAYCLNWLSNWITNGVRKLFGQSRLASSAKA